MADPYDTRRLLLIVLLSVWAMAFVYAFAFFALTPPAGDGFTRGANRITGFLGWQGVAALFALVAYAVSRVWPKGHTIRKIAVVPLLLAVLQILALIALVIWARFAA